MNSEFPPPPTDEQIKEYEKTQTAFYEAKLPFLRLKAEHDELHAKIAEARVRITRANDMFAQDQFQKQQALEEHKKKTADQNPDDKSPTGK